MTQWPFDPAEEPYVSLATFRKNGAEVLTPVWIAKAGECYYVFSAGDAGKIKRIRANGKARIAVCTFGGDIRSDWLGVEARVVTDEQVIALANQALRAKYGWQMKLGDVFSKISGRYHKRAMIELRIATETTPAGC